MNDYINCLKIKLPLLFDITSESMRYKLKIWGDYITDDNVNTFLNSLDKNPITIDEVKIDNLNFDGAYVAILYDTLKKNTIVFRSHMDSFSLFYTIDSGTIYFSDDFYSLVPLHNKYTWNLDAVADYFDLWNNICKYDRSPFKEIMRLDVGTYIYIDSALELRTKRWISKSCTEKVYNENNLSEFKEEFISLINHYLKKIENEDNLTFSLSGGLDSNTLAAAFSKISNKAVNYVTSKIDDVTDESELAMTMKKVVNGPISLINIPMNEIELLSIIDSYLDKHLPPRFFNELNVYVFYSELLKSFCDTLYVSGMGADGAFGFFGSEYSWLLDELIQNKEYDKAKRVYIAIQRSFSHITMPESEFDRKFLAYKTKVEFRNSRLGNMLRNLKNKLQSDVDGRSIPLIVTLPTFESKKIESFSDAIEFAAHGDGALRAHADVCRELGLRIVFPYEGFKFRELSDKCDPFIWCDRVNKACMRYSVRELLPREILNNVVKTGNPGMTIEKVLKSNDNIMKVIGYLETSTSSIVDIDRLKEHFRSGNVGRYDFLALCLLKFENKIINKYSVHIETR